MRLKAYNDGARSFWLEGYGGRRWTVDRVKHPQPIIIPRFAVSWIGGDLQPSRLAEVMKDADDGLLAQFNYFWPEPIPFRRPRKTPDTTWAITALDRLRQELVHDENGFRPFFVHLHHRAADRLEVLGRELQEQKVWTAGLMRSATGRARGLVLRLSLVLEFLRWCASDSALLPPPEFISEESLNAAAKLVMEYLLPMAERTYGDAAASEEDINTAMLAAWIVKERPKEVHVSTMVRRVRLTGMKDAKSVHAACKALIEAGWLGQPETGAYQQRRREAYITSPHLYEALDRCNSCNSCNSGNPR